MSTKENQQLGSTAACVVRGVQSIEMLTRFPTVRHEDQEMSKRLYFGDSWLGSVKVCAAVAKADHRARFIINTCHSKPPRAWLEEKIMEYTWGTWITLVAIPEKDIVPLICIKYKYNKKKELTFLMTE